MDFAEHFYKPDPNSKYCFMPFKDGNTSAWHPGWQTPDAIVRPAELTHPTLISDGPNKWGWERGFELESSVPNALDWLSLAIWLFRDKDVGVDGGDRLLTCFKREFGFVGANFARSFSAAVDLSENRCSWADLEPFIGDPPDRVRVPPVRLESLKLRAIGSAPAFSIDAAPRLNIITGDNGLGKTFFLDTAWWAFTGSWPDWPALPIESARRTEPEISFRMNGGVESTAFYDWTNLTWDHPSETTATLGVYARSDGSFAFCDSANGAKGINLSSSEVWNGRENPVAGERKTVINGLLRDWISWQDNDPEIFGMFRRVLASLSPPDLGTLIPDKPMRLPRDARLHPTIRHPYGRVPVIFSAAGVRRVLTVAYMLVWAWSEHRTSSLLARKEPLSSMVVMLDEIEAHLHPRWQRVILSSLLEMGRQLETNLDVQYFIGTHSPLVLASLEPRFDIERDRLFHLRLSGNDVKLEELPWVRYGPVDAWLTSNIFELAQARSKEAEDAIAEAKRLQLEADPDASEVKEVSEKLSLYLAENDEFWPRWLYFAEKHGVPV